MRYRILIEQDEDSVFVAECPALPGCISQGKTRQEAIANIQDAIKGYLASLKKHKETVPPSVREEVVEDEDDARELSFTKGFRQSEITSGCQVRLAGKSALEPLRSALYPLPTALLPLTSAPAFPACSAPKIQRYNAVCSVTIDVRIKKGILSPRRQERKELKTN